MHIFYDKYKSQKQVIHKCLFQITKRKSIHISATSSAVDMQYFYVEKDHNIVTDRNNGLISPYMVDKICKFTLELN